MMPVPGMQVQPEPGRFPAELHAEFQAEGLVLLEEGLACSVSFAGYRGPHFPDGSGTQQTLAAIAVTRRRLVIWTGRSKHVDLPHQHPLRDVVGVSLGAPERMLFDAGAGAFHPAPADRILFEYDAGAFHPERSGQVTVCLCTPQASRVMEALATD
jgi:hypothetical protein